MTKKRYALLAVPAVVAAGLWFGRTPKPAAAEAITAKPMQLVAPGRVEPSRDAVKLAFEAQGRIAEILFDEGDLVTAGQVLARLDDRLPRARVAAADAGLAQAKARYLLARRGPRKEDLDAAKAEVDA